MLKHFVVISLVLLFHTGLMAGTISPAQLRCENLKNPLAIDVALPLFSWNIESAQRDQQQTAYELIVSDNMNDVANLKGNVWSTGKVATANTINIQYSGTQLQSTKRYYWRVKVYDNKGEGSAWSDVASFETAMLNASDWTAKWIGDGSKNPAEDKDAYKDDRMPLFRDQFKVSKKIQSARLYITGLGYYEAYLNGKKISDNVLDPGFTTYRKEV